MSPESPKPRGLEDAILQQKREAERSEQHVKAIEHYHKVSPRGGLSGAIEKLKKAEEVAQGELGNFARARTKVESGRKKYKETTGQEITRKDLLDRYSDTAEAVEYKAARQNLRESVSGGGESLRRAKERIKQKLSEISGREHIGRKEVLNRAEEKIAEIDTEIEKTIQYVLERLKQSDSFRRTEQKIGENTLRTFVWSVNSALPAEVLRDGTMTSVVEDFGSDYVARAIVLGLKDSPLVQKNINERAKTILEKKSDYRGEYTAEERSEQQIEEDLWNLLRMKIGLEIELERERISASENTREVVLDDNGKKRAEAFIVLSDFLKYKDDYKHIVKFRNEGGNISVIADLERMKQEEIDRVNNSRRARPSFLASLVGSAKRDWEQNKAEKDDEVSRLEREGVKLTENQERSLSRLNEVLKLLGGDARDVFAPALKNDGPIYLDYALELIKDNVPMLAPRNEDGKPLDAIETVKLLQKAKEQEEREEKNSQKINKYNRRMREVLAGDYTSAMSFRR